MAKTNGVDLGKELTKFYDKKAQDHGGGMFFKVFRLGRCQETIWAKSVQDLTKFLKEAQVPYDKLIPLT